MLSGRCSGELDEEALELIHALQVQQIDLNRRMMEKWSEIGDLLAEILENNYKVLSILRDEAEKGGKSSTL